MPSGVEPSPKIAACVIRTETKNSPAPIAANRGEQASNQKDANRHIETWDSLVHKRHHCRIAGCLKRKFGSFRVTQLYDAEQFTPKTGPKTVDFRQPARQNFLPIAGNGLYLLSEQVDVVCDFFHFSSANVVLVKVRKRTVNVRNFVVSLKTLKPRFAHEIIVNFLFVDRQEILQSI